MRNSSAPFQTGPDTHPASCTMESGSFPGLNRPECVSELTRPFNVGWEIYFHLPSVSAEAYLIVPHAQGEELRNLCVHLAKYKND